jgi:hypothetical protein
MKHLRLILRGALCAAVLGLGSCGGDGGGEGTPDAGTSGGADAGPGPVTSGTYNHYATNTLKIGSTPAEAMGYGFNIDGKAGIDNSLGTFLAGLNSTLGADATIAEALTMGDFIILHSVRADDLSTDSSVSWRILLGNAQAMPKYDGTGTFTVSTSSPQDAIVTGAISGGKFSGGPATVDLEIAIVPGGDPLRVTLNAVRLEANVTANGCMSGRLGGAVESQELLESVAPLLATELTARIQADAGCYNPQAPNDYSGCDSTNATIRGLIDKNPSDGVISEAEITGPESVVAILFTPDVDILKADGTPGTDSVNESVSMAVGFTCVKGTFTAQGE